MANIYQQFLRAPNESALAPDASFNYITTATTINKSDAIIKHLQAQSAQILKKDEKILSTIENDNGVCLEIETVMEFKRGGGVILPKMDDNMLIDTTAVCPMVHIVTLNDQGKIQQVRIYWDQATLLRQVEAIGKSGRNWPIIDGKVQVKTVRDSTSNLQNQGNAQSTTGQADKMERAGDKYTTRLFATGNEEDSRSQSRHKLEIEPRESAEPPQRQWDELFPGEDTESTDSPSQNRDGTRSPFQPSLKSGAGKNFEPNRLFDEKKDEAETVRSPAKRRADESKYAHFEFGNDEDAPKPNVNPQSAKYKQQVRNVDFEEFNTPMKPVTRPNRKQESQLDYGNDEETLDDNAQSQYNQQKQPLNTITNIDNSPRPNEDQHSNIDGSAIEAKDKTTTTTNSGLAYRARVELISNWTLDDMENGTPEPYQKVYKTVGDGRGGNGSGPTLWDLQENDEPIRYGSEAYKTAENGFDGKKNELGPSWSLGD